MLPWMEAKLLRLSLIDDPAERTAAAFRSGYVDLTGANETACFRA